MGGRRRSRLHAGRPSSSPAAATEGAGLAASESASPGCISGAGIQQPGDLPQRSGAAAGNDTNRGSGSVPAAAGEQPA